MNTINWIERAWEGTSGVIDDIILNEYKGGGDAADVERLMRRGLAISEFGDDVDSEIDDAFLYVNDDLLPYLIGAHLFEIDAKYNNLYHGGALQCLGLDPGECHYQWFISGDRFLSGFSRLSFEQKWITYLITVRYVEFVAANAAVRPDLYPDDFVQKANLNLERAVASGWTPVQNFKW